MGKKRRTFSAEQKTKIVLEALKEYQPLSELAQKHQVHPSQITLWKKQAIDGLPDVFGAQKGEDSKGLEEKVSLLYQQIGKLQFELDWLKKKTGQS